MIEKPLRDRLNSVPVLDHLDLVGAPVARALRELPSGLVASISVAPIDPALADTAAFCARYDVLPAESANCVVVAGRRGAVTTLAACVVLATTRTDVNGLVRRLLDVRKVSFASMDVAVSASGMEYGGITPIGLPTSWPVFVDRAVVDAGDVVVGSGIRASKIIVSGEILAALGNAGIVDGLGQPAG